MKLTNYQESLTYLYGLQRMGVKLGLTNIRLLLESLGNPQRKFHNIHVAGSNGKGSTCAYLANILQRAGFKTGLYTSPHLIDFTERIRINGQRIPRERVAGLSEKLRLLVKKIPAFNKGPNYPTYFEMVTAMGFQYFSEEKVDIVVLETGLGGRLDATNVADPLLGIITNICMEHTLYLGETLAEIAREKAGIIKKHAQVLTAVTQDEALRCLKQTCKEQKADLHRLQDETKVLHKQSRSRQVFTVKTPCGTLCDLTISLLGDFQLQNALLAVRAAQLLAEKGWAITGDAIRQGLSRTVWPGRMQVMSARPWLLLDGAHNPAAISGLLDDLSLFPHQKLIAVLGVMEDKDINDIISLFEKADTLILTRADISRAALPQELAGALKDRKREIIITGQVPQAIQQAEKLAQEEDLICVTGSLYIVGEAQAYLNKIPLEKVRSVQ